MKEVLIYSAGAFVVIQTLVLLAVLAAAARPVPEFERQREVKRGAEFRRPVQREEELELVS